MNWGPRLSNLKSLALRSWMDTKRKPLQGHPARVFLAPWDPLFGLAELGYAANKPRQSSKCVLEAHGWLGISSRFRIHNLQFHQNPVSVLLKGFGDMENPESTNFDVQWLPLRILGLRAVEEGAQIPGCRQHISTRDLRPNPRAKARKTALTPHRVQASLARRGPAHLRQRRPSRACWGRSSS